MSDTFEALFGGPVSDAALSHDRRYRYALMRVWDPDRLPVMFVGLNPSTADETADDATIRRCVGFARQWGHGGVLMGNLYAFRSRHPAVLAAAWAAGHDVDGESDHLGGNVNDLYLHGMARSAATVVVAWGANTGPDETRAMLVYRLLREFEPVALGTCDNGQPRHPLFMPKDSIVSVWRPPWA